MKILTIYSQRSPRSINFRTGVFSEDIFFEQRAIELLNIVGHFYLIPEGRSRDSQLQSQVEMDMRSYSSDSSSSYRLVQ